MTDRPAPDWLTSCVYAHRGLHGVLRPENSRSAVEAAIDARLGIECDVQMSGDGVPMVFHDWQLDRLTAARGNVSAHSAEDLLGLTLQESPDTIWTLADFLQCVSGRAPALIEIKSLPQFDIAGACSAVSRILKSYSGPVAVMSFDPRMGQWFARNDPGVVRGLVTTDTYDHGFLEAWRKPRALERAQPDFLACDLRDIPNALTVLWREAGRPLLTWTVRSHAMRDHAALHADALIAEGESVG